MSLRIEYMRLEEIRPAERNAKLHSLPDIKASMRRWGFVQVPAINETTGRLVAGHGRREALIEMRADGEQPPKRVRDMGDDWAVPVLLGISFDTDEEAEAYLLADNRLTSIGGYDEAEVERILRDFAQHPERLEGTGYTERDLDVLVAFSGAGEKADARLPDIEDYEKPETQPRLIINCETQEQVEHIQERLGIEKDGKRIAHWYEEIPESHELR